MQEDGVGTSVIFQFPTSTSFTTLYTTQQGSGSALGTGLRIGTTGNGFAGRLTFPATAGTHTYKMQYGYSNTTGRTITFQNRKLWAATYGV